MQVYYHHTHSPDTGSEIHHRNTYNFPPPPIPVSKCSERSQWSEVMHSCSQGTVLLILDLCQHSYLENSKSAPVSWYQLWMSLHKYACLPAGKTQKISELPTEHISIQNRRLNRSFYSAWEIIMENKMKSTQTFPCPGNLATGFAPGKLHNDNQIGTIFLPEENQSPKGLWITEVTVLNTKSNQGVISYCKVPLVTVSERLSYCW